MQHNKFTETSFHEVTWVINKFSTIRFDETKKYGSVITLEAGDFGSITPDAHNSIKNLHDLADFVRVAARIDEMQIWHICHLASISEIVGGIIRLIRCHYSLKKVAKALDRTKVTFADLMDPEVWEKSSGNLSQMLAKEF